MNDVSDTACQVHALAVTSCEADHVSLAHIFGHTSWKLDSTRTISEALLKLNELSEAATPVVIICAEELPDGTWKELQQLIRDLPQVCSLVVMSQAQDDRIWAEVLDMCAYGVLMKPLRAQEVYRTIGPAWRHFNERRKSAARAATAGVGRTAGAVA